MNASLSYCLLSLTLAAPPQRPVPEPQPVVGESLLPGAVARLGPTAFRYAGWVGPLESGGATVWYSPDGKRIGTTSNCGVYLWDAATGKRLLWVPSDGKTLTSFLGFHTSGDVIVQCRRKSDDTGAGVFRIDPATGKVNAKFQPEGDRWFTTATPDGKIVFSRTRVNDSVAENVANEIDTGKEVWRRQMPEMRWMRISPDGSRLVVWSSRGKWELEVLDSATGKTVEKFTHPDDYSHPNWTGGGVAVAPKAEWIVGMHSWDHGFSILKSGEEKPVYRQPKLWYDNAFITKDGKRLIVTLRTRSNSALEVWDLAEKKRVSSVAADVDGSPALSPDGKTLAVAGHHPNLHVLRFFDVATGKRTPLSPEPFTQGEVVWFLPDGTLASVDEKLAQPVKWDLKTGAMTPLPAGTKPPAPDTLGDDFKPPEGTTKVVVSPTRQRAIGLRFDPEELDSSPGDTYVGLFDATGKVVQKYLRWDHTNGATYAFAPKGKTFAVARGDGTLTFFDSETGKELRTFRNAGGVGSMAYSPDGRYLATSHGDGPITVWNVSDDKK